MLTIIGNLNIKQVHLVVTPEYLTLIGNQETGCSYLVTRLGADWYGTPDQAEFVLDCLLLQKSL